MVLTFSLLFSFLSAEIGRLRSLAFTPGAFTPGNAPAGLRLHSCRCARTPPSLLAMRGGCAFTTGVQSMCGSGAKRAGLFQARVRRRRREGLCTSTRGSLHALGGDDERVLAATRAWIEEWVIGLKLCPWAAPAQRSGGVRVLIARGGLDSMADHVSLVIREAESLKASNALSEPGKSTLLTTLIAFPDACYLGPLSGCPPLSCSASESHQHPCGAFPVRPACSI